MNRIWYRPVGTRTRLRNVICLTSNAGKMLGICARYCPNIEDAKDALHEGFIKIFGQIDRFQAQSRLETWITRIMINTSIDHFKKSIKYKGFNEEDPMPEESQEADFVHLDEKDGPSMEALNEIIQQLPDGYRMVFNLYAIEGYSHKEISEELSISEGTSKSQLARARKLLKELLKDQLNIG